MPARVAVYARVATDRQAGLPTLEQQLELLHAYAAKRAWVISAESIYRDDGVSGACLTRPALARLRAAIARGDVDVLLVTRPDRLARNNGALARMLKESQRVGCQVIFLEYP